MAKNKDASSFFKNESDDDFFRDSLNGSSPLGKIFDIVKDDNGSAAKAQADVPKAPRAAQNKRTPIRDEAQASKLSELDARQKTLDARVNALITELDEKNRQIAELEYRLAQQIDKSYTHAKSTQAFEQSYTEMHKKEILDHILQDIKGLYSSVSTRAKVVEEREYQILLKMVELEERRRELSYKRQRRKSTYGIERNSPYEELAQQKLLPTDNPSLSKKINRSIDRVAHQIKTPYIALAENIDDIRPAIMAAPKPKETVSDASDMPSRPAAPSQRVQSLRQALEKETEGLEIFDKKSRPAPSQTIIVNDETPRSAAGKKQQGASHPSEEIEREFNQTKLALQKRQLEQLQKQNKNRAADNIEMDSLLDEINQVLGEQKNIENQIADVLKKDEKPIKKIEIQKKKEQEPPVQAAPAVRENVTSDTVDLEKDEMSLLSSLLDDL